MTARNGDFERAARNGLTHDVFEIGGAFLCRADDELFCFERSDRHRADKVAHHLGERARRVNLRAAQKARFFGVRLGYDKFREAVPFCRNQYGQ